MESSSKPGYCISSRTVALIIGILEIIISVVGIFYMGMRCIQSFEENQNPTWMHQLTKVVSRGLEFVKHSANLNEENDVMNTQSFNLMSLSVGIVVLVLAIILIYGITKEHLRLLQARNIIYGVLILFITVPTFIISVKIKSTTFLFIALFTLVMGVFVDTVVNCAYEKIRHNLLQRQLSTNSLLKYEHI